MNGTAEQRRVSQLDAGGDGVCTTTKTAAHFLEHEVRSAVAHSVGIEASDLVLF